MQRIIGSIAVVVVGTVLSTSAHAKSPLNQAPQVNNTNGFASSLSIGYGSDDNVLRLSQNEIDDTFFGINPELLYVQRVGKHTFSGRYTGQYKFFDELSEFDYYDHKFNLSATLEHSLRFSTRYEIELNDAIELPGENNRETTLIREFNEVERNKIAISAIYGRRTSAGQIIVSYTKRDSDYKNNEQDFRDFDFNQYKATFYYRVAPKTRLLFEAVSSEYEYTNPETFNSDSDYTLINVGADWEISAKLRGVIKIGNQEQDFASANIDNISGLAFFADVYWDINSFTILQFGADRTTRESAEIGQGSFVRTNYQINLKHEFSPRIHFEGDLQIGEDDLVFGGGRTDDRTRVQAKVMHDTHRAFDTYVGIDSFQRDSNDTLYEFDNTQFSIGITGRFGKGQD